MTTPRDQAAHYITVTGDRLKTAAGNARLTPIANALLGWVANQLQSRATELAEAQRTSSNVMTRSAAILAQQNALIASLAVAKTGASVVASTGQVIPAQGNPNEGFGGLVHIAFQALSLGSTNPSDLAQALLQMTELQPIRMRAIASALPGVQSIQAELKLCEVICAYVRRMALVQSVVAGIKVAPSRQPDASLTRARLLEQIDEETSLAANNPDLHAALRRLRRAVIKYVAWFSQGGGGAVRVPTTSAGKPLAVTAADMYAAGDVTGRDAELMQFNGVDHPLFGPSELDALFSNSMLVIANIK
jgi:hypothetical protein